MTEEKNKRKDENNQSENRFSKAQPLRHPMAVVAQENDKLKINKQLYRILINKRDAIDLETLRRKYDPYLDQYDFIVGDVSSEHLRLKGFYKDNVRTAIDRKVKAISDYVVEYCNPGAAYFVLELISPVHHYSKKIDTRNNSVRKRQYSNHRKLKLNNNFKKRRVHKTNFSKKKTISVRKHRGHKHSFVIKKRKES